MRRFFLPILLLALASPAAEVERVEMNVRLVLVDSCNVQVDDRQNLAGIQVDCPTGEPHAVQQVSEPAADPAVGAPTRLAITF